jgi:hypothetical protein
LSLPFSSIDLFEFAPCSFSLLLSRNNRGVAHPPGYPLFTILGRLFITLIPFGIKAWRVHVCTATLGMQTVDPALLRLCDSLARSSSTSGAGAAFFLYLTVAKLTKNLWPGLLTAFG